MVSLRGGGEGSEKLLNFHLLQMMKKHGREGGLRVTFYHIIQFIS